MLGNGTFAVNLWLRVDHFYTLHDGMVDPNFLFHTNSHVTKRFGRLLEDVRTDSINKISANRRFVFKIALSMN